MLRYTHWEPYSATKSTNINCLKSETSYIRCKSEQCKAHCLENVFSCFCSEGISNKKVRIQMTSRIEGMHFIVTVCMNKIF
jgi:hypothetical protein